MRSLPPSNLFIALIIDSCNVIIHNIYWFISIIMTGFASIRIAQPHHIPILAHHKPQMHYGEVRAIKRDFNVHLDFALILFRGGDSYGKLSSQNIMHSFRMRGQIYTIFFKFHALNCKKEMKYYGFLQFSWLWGHIVGFDTEKCE